MASTLSRVAWAVVCGVAVLAGVTAIVDACEGTRDCVDAGAALRLWPKHTAHLGPLEERRIRENGREATWWVGGCEYPADRDLLASPAGQRFASVRLPADPGTNFITVYVSGGGDVRAEDELLYFAKQWPRRGQLAVGIFILLAGVAAGLVSGGWLAKAAPRASSPIRAFPVLAEEAGRRSA